MKIKTLISSSLAIGFLFNTTLPSIANTLSEDTRYETLEGECITIDDSTEGELVEIEVFGNTVQDENNLEDIQSVGDLYVDEKGDPILDSQGREQYEFKIIVSTNIWDLVMDDWLESANSSSESPYYSYNNNKLTMLKTDSRNWSNVLDIKVPKPNTEYTFSSSSPDCTFAKTVQVPSNPVTYTSDSNGYIKGIKVFGEIDTEYDVKLVEGPYMNDINMVNKASILLPTQLQRVGDVADRLYWDNEKGRYIIEKNIDSFVIDDIQLAHPTYIGDDNYAYNILMNYDDDLSHGISYRHGYLITGLKDIIYNYYRKDSEPWSFDKWGAFELLIRYPKEDRFSTKEKMLEYLKENNVTLYYQIKNSQLIETNITSKLKIPTYDGKTYIFVDSENGISPILKVTVDRIINRAKEAIEAAKINPTMENISLARMWTNLIKDSTIKDGLQNEIGEITEIVDLTIEKKTATANLDLYIKSNNSLTMSLSTNSVTFENYSGVEDLEMLDAVNITINSSLPYSLNAYMPTPISNVDGSNTMDANILNIRDNSKNEYSQFINTTNKVVLKDSCEAGNNNIHNIDLKLSGNNLHEADIYKTVIKFEAEQK